MIRITEASNDKNFLGQLTPSPGTIYVFDKGYVNFSVFDQWTRQGVYFVTRLNDNAVYNIVESHTNDIEEYAAGALLGIRSFNLNLQIINALKHVLLHTKTR